MRAAAGQPSPLNAAQRLRLSVRVAMMVLAALVAVPLHYLFRLLRLSSPWPRLFLGTVGRIAGARVTRIGTPLKRDVFYVANHVSWIDILAIAGTSGSAFVAKAELERAPLVGWLAGLNRTVYVSREQRMKVADQINQLREAFADNWSVTVFPEGTTTDGQSLLPFKSPLLAVLDPPPPGVLVQPVLLIYDARGRDLAWIGDEGGRDNAVRVLARAGSFAVRCVFLDPFHPRDYPGRKAIAAEARRRIEEAFRVRTGGPLEPFIGHDWWADRRPAA
ncbi:lysophospholipid acyltransferase family protein [Sphingomonas sp.]|uniref:lysophospholipid acyltransferase family protein n=1 Tax=Sphingomonas sp. TaxID=28214 RepID=UPI002CBEBAF2|nr:lysophospholipid acyltransferase family protein [Sphingomonas sp.]HTG38875.1 lysophospholipid acyltransferase family protein [Sphingomonas sp.]